MTDIRDQACAIVVTYHPQLDELRELLTQINSESDFILVDNGSPQIDELADAILEYDRCKRLISLARNEGLAHGLNIGIEWVRKTGHGFVLLFDQDSKIGEGFVQKMLTAWRDINAVASKGVAVLGPRIVNPQSKRRTPFKVFNRLFGRSNRKFASKPGFFEAGFLITSGSLIPMSALNEVGGMKDDFFIDNVDLEWCFRATAMGYDVVGTDAAQLYHSIGESSRNPLVQAGIMAQHNPSRTYYSSRNRTYLYSVDYAPTSWKIRDRIRFFCKSCWLLLASSERAAYWENIRNGVRDSVTLGKP